MGGTTWKYEFELENQRQRIADKKRRVRQERFAAAFIAAAALAGGIITALTLGLA